MKKIYIVSATRVPNAEAFYTSTRLGVCLDRHSSSFDITEREIIYGNKAGLSEVYNRTLERVSEIEDVDDWLIAFAHDDLSIDDVAFHDKLEKAAERFDVIGLAGADFEDKQIPSAWHLGDKRGWSGAVAHTRDNLTWMSSFGVMPRPVSVIDGLFIAIKLKSVVDSGLRFDERFTFHHYDLDFCLSARAFGLKVGVIPLWVTHASLGDGINTDAWRRSADIFIEKWNK